LRPGRYFPGGGTSMKIKNFRPVYGHLNALQLSISVHQRCSVHQIHLRPGLPHTHAGELLTLSSRLGPWARRGGRPGATDPRAATANEYMYIIHYEQVIIHVHAKLHHQFIMIRTIFQSASFLLIRKDKKN